LFDSKNFNNSYEGLLGLLIVDFGVRIVFLDIRVVGIARARGKKIILFGKGINEGNKARISRFSAFLCSFYRLFFRLLRRQFLYLRFRLLTFGLLSHSAAGPRLSPDDLRIEKETYLIFREHWSVSVVLSLIPGLSRSDKISCSKGRGKADLVRENAYKSLILLRIVSLSRSFRLRLFRRGRRSSLISRQLRLQGGLFLSGSIRN
jgi:hypothetical protein